MTKKPPLKLKKLKQANGLEATDETKSFIKKSILMENDLILRNKYNDLISRKNKEQIQQIYDYLYEIKKIMKTSN